LKKRVKRVDVVVHGSFGLLAQALKLGIDADILKVKRLGIFVFKACPNCDSITFDGGNLSKVVGLKSFKQRFKSKVMAFLPIVEHTTAPGTSCLIVAIIVRDDRLEISALDDAEALVHLEGGFSLDDPNAVFTILKLVELDAPRCLFVRVRHDATILRRWFRFQDVNDGFKTPMKTMTI
jgi:hypothetical protein